MEDLTTTVVGVGGGERSAMMMGDSMETLGATARATESSKAEAGAADVVLESMVQRPAASKEQAVHPEMPRGMVGHFV